MRIVFVAEWFSEAMGYVDNCLPRAFAGLGHEVHLVAPNVQPYFHSPLYEQTYEQFLGKGVVPVGCGTIDGVLIHRLPHINWRGRLGGRGLISLLRGLKPDVVQASSHISLGAMQAAIARRLLKFPLFTANHVVASVYPPPGWRSDSLKWRIKIGAGTTLPGRLVAGSTTLCYAATVDAADIAERFFGVPRSKLRVMPLGVDTDLFSPGPRGEADRTGLCREAQIPTDGVLCIYTGRFSTAKDPACLARAISRLRSAGHPYGAVFIGDGEQREAIAAEPGCVIRPFVPFRSLPPLYRAADVGVWPRQESISMLDASASGLPIVVSERIRARERVEGVGLTYQEGNERDLARVLLELRTEGRRAELGLAGAKRVATTTSWRSVASRRLEDYERALAGDLRP